jgi:hypothetical protein
MWKSSGKTQVKTVGMRACLPVGAAKAMDEWERTTRMLAPQGQQLCEWRSLLTARPAARTAMGEKHHLVTKGRGHLLGYVDCLPHQNTKGVQAEEEGKRDIVKDMNVSTSLHPGPRCIKTCAPDTCSLGSFWSRGAVFREPERVAWGKYPKITQAEIGRIAMAGSFPMRIEAWDLEHQ